MWNPFKKETPTVENETWHCGVAMENIPANPLCLESASCFSYKYCQENPIPRIGEIIYCEDN